MTPVVIDLTQGKVALVSAEDYAEMSKHKWHAVLSKTSAGAEKWYAARGEQRDGRIVRIYMHRKVLGLGAGRELIADHINGNGLDNRRENLRAVDASGNSRNVTLPGRKPRGVFSQGGGFMARIGKEYLGFFETEAEAAFAVNERLYQLDGTAVAKNRIDISDLVATLEARRDAIQERIDAVRRWAA